MDCKEHAVSSSPRLLSVLRLLGEPTQAVSTRHGERFESDAMKVDSGVDELSNGLS